MNVSQEVARNAINLDDYSAINNSNINNNMRDDKLRVRETVKLQM